MRFRRPRELTIEECIKEIRDDYVEAEKAYSNAKEAIEHIESLLALAANRGNFISYGFGWLCLKIAQPAVRFLKTQEEDARRIMRKTYEIRWP